MSIIKCPECGHQISEEAKVCPICGIGIAGKVVRCAYCGEVYLRADGLCPNCHRPTKAVVFDDDEEMEEAKGESAKVSESSTKSQDLQEPNNSDTDTILDNDGPQGEDSSQEEGQYIDEEAPQLDNALNEKKTQEEIKEADVKKEDDDTYIDDEESEDEDEASQEVPAEEQKPERRHSFMPIAVSLAITALIAAVCLYFYRENKLTNERADLNAAINAGTRDAIWNFQRNHPDMSEESKQRAADELKKLDEREQQEALISMSHNKADLQAFISKYPNHPKKAQLLLTIDSLDWEEAKRINKSEAYEKYIAEHSNGVFINEAKEKIAVKPVTATEADKGMAKSLFRNFFLAVNGKDTGQLTSSMDSKITSFMGKENASKDDVVAWMKQQYEDGVQTVTWALDHNYNIRIIEQNSQKDYTMDFTGHRTSIHNDGRAVTEHFKFNAKVTNKKISSLTMEKYTPSANSNSSKPSGSTGSNGANSNSKPSNSNSTSSTSSTSKPNTNQSQSKPSTNQSQSKPSTSQSKPNTSQSKPSTSQSKPSTSQSKPSTSQSKPSTSQSKPSTSQSKPNTSQSKPNTSQSKPNTSQSKPNTNQNKPASQGGSSTKK